MKYKKHYNEFDVSNIQGDLKRRYRNKRWEKVGTEFTKWLFIIGLLSVTALFIYDLVVTNFYRDTIPQVHAQIIRQENAKYWAVRAHLLELNS